MDPRPGGEAMVDQRLLGGDQQSGGGVRDLRGDGGGDAAAGRQRRQRGHLLQARVAARSFVRDDIAVSYGLALETPLILGTYRALVAQQGEALHVLTADVPLLGDQLRAAELADLFIPVAGRPAL